MFWKRLIAVMFHQVRSQFPAEAYLVDSALAAHLTRQPGAAALWHGAMGGAFFEGKTGAGRVPAANLRALLTRAG